jgi:hypothetical protein
MMESPIINRAIQLIDRGWCQLCMARDSFGRPLPFTSEGATEFCLTGAMLRSRIEAANRLGPHLLEQVETQYVKELHVLIRLVGVSSLSEFNDHPRTTKTDVLQVMLIAQRRINEQQGREERSLYTPS